MTQSRLAVAAVLALALLPSVLALNSRGFFSPDETYYTEVAREMAQTGDLVVPRFDGHPFLEKPPLVYWLLAGAFGLLGWGFPAAVLLNTLLTAATALVLLFHVRRTVSPRAGLVAAVAYLTMLLPTAAARTALADPSLTLCTTGSIVALLGGTAAGTTLGGALLGLGILAKGPVAPLVVGPVLAAMLVLRRDRRVAGHVLLALGVATLVALPWHLALASRGLLHEYLRVFLGQQVVSRAVDAWRQEQPWWFYLPVAWAAVFPWGLHAVSAARRWWRDVKASAPPRATSVAWGAAVLVPLLAFSMSTNKFPHYLLPLLPWVAAALGRWADRALADARGAERAGRIGLAAAGANAGALVAGALLLVRSPFGALAPRDTAAVLFASAAGFLLAGILERRRPALGWTAAAVVALSLHAFADAIVVPRLDSYTVERTLAARVRAALPPGGVPIAHRWFRPSLVTYGVRGWRHTLDARHLEVALSSAASTRRPALVETRDDFEGEVRAVLWSRGGEARTLARVTGLGELDGSTIGAVIFAADTPRDGRRWFYDADRLLDGVAGFSGLEGNRWTPTFRWSVQRDASLTVDADPAGPAVVAVRAWGPPAPADRQRVAVTLNGVSIGTLDLGRLPRVTRVPVPAGALRLGGPQTLVFSVSALHRPKDVDPASPDVRTLAFALDWVALEPTADTIDLVPTER